MTHHNLLRAAGVCLLASALTLPASAALTVIDFESDGFGNPLSNGDVITNQFANLGLNISATGGSGDARIFDTSLPSQVWDNDLFTPGPHPTNNVALGNVLIVDNDNPRTAPDDDPNGGSLFFAWDFPIDLEYVDLLDIEGNEGVTITARDVSNAVIQSLGVSGLGNNSFQQVDLDPLLWTGVRQLEIAFSSSGATTAVAYNVIPEPAHIIGAFSGLLLLLTVLRRRFAGRS